MGENTVVIQAQKVKSRRSMPFGASKDAARLGRCTCDVLGGQRNEGEEEREEG